MKPGFQTSEFLLTALLILSATLSLMFDKIDGDAYAIAIAGAVAFYNVSRGLAKINPPKDTESALD